MFDCLTCRFKQQKNSDSFRLSSRFALCSIFNDRITFSVRGRATIFVLTVWACCSTSTSMRVGIRMCFDSKALS